MEREALELLLLLRVPSRCGGEEEHGGHGMVWHGSMALEPGARSEYGGRLSSNLRSISSLSEMPSADDAVDGGTDIVTPFQYI